MIVRNMQCWNIPMFQSDGDPLRRFVPSLSPRFEGCIGSNVTRPRKSFQYTRSTCVYIIFNIPLFLSEVHCFYDECSHVIHRVFRTRVVLNLIMACSSVESHAEHEKTWPRSKTHVDVHFLIFGTTWIFMWLHVALLNRVSGSFTFSLQKRCKTHQNA